MRDVSSFCKHNVVLGLVAGLQVCLLWFTSGKLSITRDEPANIAAGLEYWETGSSLRYNVNPPLVKLWATLPLHFVHRVPAPKLNAIDTSPTERYEFRLGHQLVRDGGPLFFRQLLIARRMCVVLTVAGTLGIYALAGLWFEPSTRLWAAALWAFNPITLGYGVLVTCDIPSASIGVWATYSCVIAWRQASVGNLSVAGGMLGLAMLTKLTWILALPIVVSLAVLMSIRRILQSKTRAAVIADILAGLAWMLAVAWIFVVAGYRAEGCLSTLGEHEFVSRMLTEGLNEGNRFRDGWLDQFPIPIPSPMLLGLDQQWQDFDEPRDCYLAGHWQKGGWYYFYAFALLVKLPLGLVCLSLLAIPKVRAHSESSLICATIAGVIFIVVSLKTNMNEHTRYLWIFLPQLIVFAVQAFDQTRPWKINSVRLLALWCVTTGIFTVPCGISYFNELQFLQREPQPLLAGSNIDWGQGWILANDWIRDNSAPDQPIVVLSSRLEELRAIGLHTTEINPAAANEKDIRVLILVALDHRLRMEMQSEFSQFKHWQFSETIGCCLEVYEARFSQLPSHGWKWVESTTPVESEIATRRQP